MDYVNAMFVGMTVAFVVMPLLLKYVDGARLPVAVVRLYAYGKITGGARPSGFLSVPKRWYKHFYVFAAVAAETAWLVLFHAYWSVSPWPAATEWCARWLWDPIRRPEPSYSAAAAFTAISMISLQCHRRTYETHMVSVFSDTAVGLWYYASGYMHYAGALATVLTEAPAAPGPFCVGWLDAGRIAVGALLFSWAYREQWRANVALAAARKTADGRVVTHEHKVLDGGLFDLVSSPQMLTEVVVYGALYVVLWGSSGWKYVVLFVWGNQFEIALINHRWYQEKFEDYPRNRKAIIPYLL